MRVYVACSEEGEVSMMSYPRIRESSRGYEGDQI